MSDPMAEMIAALARLADLPEEAARLGAPLVEAALKKSAKAGTTPAGVSWPAKKDGSAPLVNAAAAISTKANGKVITTKLSGVNVIHNFGTKLGATRSAQISDAAGAREAVEAIEKSAKKAHESAKKAAKAAGQAAPEVPKSRSVAQRLGAYHTPPRQIIPDAEEAMPAALIEAIKKAADAAFDKAMGGT
jgi:hypothetical protein